MDETNGAGDAHGMLDTTVGHVKDAAGAAMDTAKQGAMSLAGTAKDKVSDTFEQSRQAVGHTLVDFAEVIRKAGDDLAERDQSLAGRLVKQAADGLEGLANAASTQRPEALLTAARAFGRANPMAFVAGSVLLGVALGRFAKSSASHGSTTSPRPVSAPAAIPASTAAASAENIPVAAVVWTGETDPVEQGVLSPRDGRSRLRPDRRRFERIGNLGRWI